MRPTPNKYTINNKRFTVQGSRFKVEQYQSPNLQGIAGNQAEPVVTHWVVLAAVKKPAVMSSDLCLYNRER
jgi:hypothetical protein